MKEFSLMSIAGARPNFMKLASIARAIESFNVDAECDTFIRHILVHTGQHYDEKMSESFFRDLRLPRPDINLEVGSGTHASQTAEIMRRFEPVLLSELPDVLLVVGDVNSTIACTLVASKIEYPGLSNRRRPLVVHVEAGLRSFDRSMPEEINRILTDALSDLLFVTEESGVRNLKAEGVDAEKVHLVGNVMIDTLIDHLDRARQTQIQKALGLFSSYGIITLHRPSNVDDPGQLEALVRCLVDISADLQMVFPVHPRTRKNLHRFGLMKHLDQNGRIVLAEPLGYLDFLGLVASASVVLSDSGGVQEETTYLGVPCVTLRENTERPVTVSVGSNYLIGTRPNLIVGTVRDILSGNGKKASIPPLWDGAAGGRIIRIIAERVREDSSRYTGPVSVR